MFLHFDLFSAFSVWNSGHWLAAKSQTYSTCQFCRRKVKDFSGKNFLQPAAPKITRYCQLFFSSVTEFINRTILTVILHILNQWNHQENDIRMTDDWWFWFISFSRLFFCSFLKNVKYEKSMYKKIKYFHTCISEYCELTILISYL